MSLNRPSLPTPPRTDARPEADETSPAARSPADTSRHSLLRQMFRFALVGTAGFVVNAALVEALAGALGPIGAQGLAFPVAVTTTWWLNRRFTFAGTRHRRGIEFLRYVGANTFGWIVNNGVYLALVLNSVVAHRHAALAVAAGSLAGMAFNFCTSKWLVFR